MSNVLIIGTSHHNTLSMVRSFGEEGKKVILYIYGEENSYIASSVYVKSVSYFKTALDAINSISTQVLSTGKKVIVIACSDEVSSLMDLHYDDLTKYCYFFNAGKSGRVTYFMDKQTQLVLAKKCGFSVAFSIDALPNDVNVDNVKYPCFVKPKISIYGGKNIAICNSKEELKKTLMNYNPMYNVLVQDYIQKEYEIVILGLSARGQIIIPGFVQKHREEKGGTTYSTVRPISQINDSIVTACKTMINEIGYEGLWGIECIKQGEKYFFLELNMRNDATTYAIKVAGVNLPCIYQYIVESEDFTSFIKPIRIINSIVEFNDFNFVLKRKLSLFQWIKEYKMAECKYFHSILDLEPYKRKRYEYIKFLFKYLFRI